MKLSLQIDENRYKLFASKPKKIVPISFAALTLCIAQPRYAMAASECGADTAGSNTVNCAAGAYNNGITYTNSDGLTVKLDDPNINMSNKGVAVSATAASSGDLRFDGTRFGTINLATGNGVLMQTRGSGNVTVSLGSGGISSNANNSVGAKAGISKTSSQADTNVTMDSTDASIMMTSDNSNGLQSTNDGNGTANASIANGTIKMSGFFAAAVSANSAGDAGSSASATISGGTIATSGIRSRGLKTTQDGLGSSDTAISGGVIDGSGNYSVGIFAQITNSDNANVAQSSVSGGAINQTGETSTGVLAATAGTGQANVSMSGGAVTVFGDHSTGLSAINSNIAGNGATSVNMSGGSVTASGTDSDGVSALSGSAGSNTIAISGGSVTSSNGLGASLHTAGHGTNTITIGAAATIDSGVSGIAIRDGDRWTDADKNGNPDSDNNGDGISDLNPNLPSFRQQSDGIDEDYNASDATVNTAGTVTGDATLGLGNDTFNLTDGTYTGSIYGDDRGYAPSDDSSANHEGNDTFNWTGGRLRGGFYGQDGSDTANIAASSQFDGSQLMDGGDGIGLSPKMVDTLNLTGLTATVRGDRLTNWETINLRGGILTFADSSLAVSTRDGEGLFLSDKATMKTAQDFALSGNMTTETGTRFEAAGGRSGKYSVTGNVINDGTIAMSDGKTGDALTIEGDYSGSGLVTMDVDTHAGSGDLITINGNRVSGSSQLQIRNTTPGRGNGQKISLVEASATAASTAFQMANSFEAGAFTYSLSMGGKNWYLNPDYSPSTAVYENYLPNLAALFKMANRVQRLENRYFDDAADNAFSGSPVPDNGDIASKDPYPWLWTVMEGADMRLSGHASTTGASALARSWKVRAGADGVFFERESGEWVGGFNAFYGTSNSTISYRLGDGGIGLDGFGAGVSASWFGKNGFYVDAQAMAGRSLSTLQSTVGGVLIENNSAQNLSAAVEIGKRFTLDGHHVIVPQAEISISHVSFDPFAGHGGGQVFAENSNSVQARIGVDFETEKAVELHNGSTLRQTIYTTANLYHEFSDNLTTSVADTHVMSSSGEWIAEVGFGGHLSWNSDRCSLSSQLTFASDLSNLGQSYTARAQIGFSARF